MRKCLIFISKPRFWLRPSMPGQSYDSSCNASKFNQAFFNQEQHDREVKKKAHHLAGFEPTISRVLLCRCVLYRCAATLPNKKWCYISPAIKWVVVREWSGFEPQRDKIRSNLRSSLQLHPFVHSLDKRLEPKEKLWRPTFSFRPTSNERPLLCSSLVLKKRFFDVK